MPEFSAAYTCNFVDETLANRLAGFKHRSFLQSQNHKNQGYAASQKAVW